MKNKPASLLRRLLSAVISTVILTVTLTAVLSGTVLSSSAQEDTPQDIIDGILTAEAAQNSAASLQEWLDGALTEGAGRTSEWFVLSLRQYRPDLNFTSYAEALEARLSGGEIRGAVERQRCALLLIACGKEKSPAVADVAAKNVGAQGIMSLIFGLHLANNGVVSEQNSASDIADRLLSLQLADGGWALGGEISNVDVTAMTVQALSPFYSSAPAVKEAVDKAIALLGSRQLESGVYQSYGSEDPESAAQVITALTSVGIDPAADSRFIKSGGGLLDGMLSFRLTEGGFCHTKGGGRNPTATAQALYSLVALYRLRSGASSLYIFNKEDIPAATTVRDTQSEVSLTDAAPSTGEKAPAGEDTRPPAPASEKKYGYKPWACLVIILAAAAACIALAVTGKRNCKNFILVGAVAAILLCAVLFINIESADVFYDSQAPDASDSIGSVTLTIRCDNAVGKVNSGYLPEDGVILPVTEFPLHSGDTVYDLLTAAARQYGIQLESSGMQYIEGINYLYEFDCGDLSGWVFRVNGETPSVGCGSYRLCDGDRVEWLYTCELGGDLN